VLERIVEVVRRFASATTLPVAGAPAINAFALVCLPNNSFALGFIEVIHRLWIGSSTMAVFSRLWVARI